jgi:hypothetical protein
MYRSQQHSFRTVIIPSHVPKQLAATFIRYLPPSDREASVPLNALHRQRKELPVNLSTAIRRRLAVGLAGALLGATLIAGAVSVSADDDASPKLDRDAPPAQGSEATAPQTTFVVVQFPSAQVVSDDAAATTAQDSNQIDRPNDRN